MGILGHLDSVPCLLSNIVSGSDGSWGWASGGHRLWRGTAAALGLDPDQRGAACVSGGGAEAVTVPEPGCGAAVTMLLSPWPGACPD